MRDEGLTTSNSSFCTLTQLRLKIKLKIKFFLLLIGWSSKSLWRKPSPRWSRPPHPSQKFAQHGKEIIYMKKLIFVYMGKSTSPANKWLRNFVLFPPQKVCSKKLCYLNSNVNFFFIFLLFSFYSKTASHAPKLCPRLK